MKIFHIGDRIAHHAGRSGYDQLKAFTGARSLPESPRKLMAALLKALPSPCLKPWFDAPPHAWYWKENQLAAEIQAMACVPFEKAVFHWIYGENDFRWAGIMPRNKQSRVVVSLHQPPEVFRKVFPKPHRLEKADALVACAFNQQAFLQEFAGAQRVHLIPHGVDTQFFCPTQGYVDPKGPFTVLFVGSWLRDLSCLGQVIHESNSLDTGIRFNLLLPIEEKMRFTGLANTKVYRGVSDLELLSLYRGANVLFMPLEDCTASNTLLEAMACGLPQVISDVGGARDYTNDSCALFIPMRNKDQALDALVDLKNQAQMCNTMAAASRERALHFNWPVIAKTMMEMYANLYA